MQVLNIDDLVLAMEGGREPVSARNHPLAPQHGGGLGSFRWLITGRSGAGKTNLIVSMLLKSEIQFDHLYLCVRDPTQPKYKLLLRWINSLEDMIKQSTGESISLVTLCSDSNDIVPVDQLNSSIINVAIFDDMILENQRRILDYFIRGRHRSVSCIYLGQSYHLVDVSIRKQCDYFSVFAVSSKAELIQLSKEHSLTHEYREFKDILSKATAGSKGNFLLIDRRTDDPLLTLRKNWDQVWNPVTKEFETLFSQ
jgi:hypothetical protein